MPLRKTERMLDRVKEQIKGMGVSLLVFPEEMRPQLSPDVSALLDEQRKTNELLALLIQALADEADPDTTPTTYMDGTPVR